MVEQRAAGIDYQRVTELLAKYLMGMPDQQHIMPESQQVLRPAGLFCFDEIAIDIQQPDATLHRIRRTGMHHVQTLALDRQLQLSGQRAKPAAGRRLFVRCMFFEVPDLMIAEHRLAIMRSAMRQYDQGPRHNRRCRRGREYGQHPAT